MSTLRQSEREAIGTAIQRSYLERSIFGPGGIEAEKRLKAWNLATVSPPRVAETFLASARGYHFPGGTWFNTTWTGKAATMAIGDEIGCYGATAKDALDSLAGAKSVELIVDSYGGDSEAALELHRGLKGRVKKAFIFCACQSAAVTVAMSAKRILADPSARVMVHSPRLCRFGGAARLRQSADYLDRLTGEISSVIVKRTGQPAGVVEKWFTGDNYFSAQEALDVHLIDEILPARKRPRSQPGPATAGTGKPAKTQEERELLELLRLFGPFKTGNRQRLMREVGAWICHHTIERI